MAEPPAADAAPPTPAAQQIALVWARELRAANVTTLNMAQLTGMLAQWVMALLGRPVDPRAPGRIGAGLVAAHFTRVESLSATIETLGRELPEPGRAHALAGVAAGYAEALREQVRAEQQQIIAAALHAREDAENARWASEARFAAVFAEAPIGISVATLDGDIVEVNERACAMFGYSRADLIRLNATDFQHPDDPADMWTQYAELVAGQRGYFRTDKPFYRSDSTTIWTDMVASLVRDKLGQPQYVLAMAEDITDRNELRSRLSHQAQHDPLTGLPNRATFFERLEAVLAAGQLSGARVTDRLGLCYLDLDGFKAVNDTLGHDIGDELLKIISGRLAQAAGPGVLVARTGGDEFVLLLEDVDAATAVTVADRALAAVRQPIRLGGQVLTASASIGLVHGTVGPTAADLMKAADTTVYWAKSQGRNRVAYFDADRHHQDVTRYELIASLPDALAGGELFLEYQPLVRLADDRVVGVEALVRWAHPRLGTLGPDMFIPLAEENGLISKLGKWVLVEACEQAARWRAEFGDRLVLMSVNLAPHQVQNPALVGDLAGLLARTGVPPSLIQLELTESAVMAGAGVPLATLHALAALGCRIAIDDFGTGYSNLAYLRTLPVHAVKLAGPFVSGLRGGDVDPVSRDIVDGLIRLSHTLSLSVTAEGVETAAQATMLRLLDCDLAQGYLYGQPMSAEAINRLLAKD
jgi:diguanylate cyclase (GGDEF)-like protein/PAS domain S-box-containing protein